jgi:hypothetical protein
MHNIKSCYFSRPNWWMSLTLNTRITSRVATSLGQTDKCHSHWTHASHQSESSTQLVQEVLFKHHWLPCAVTYHWFWENDTVYSLMWTLKWPYIRYIFNCVWYTLFRNQQRWQRWENFIKIDQKKVINVWSWPTSKLQQMMLKNAWVAFLDHLNIS